MLAKRMTIVFCLLIVIFLGCGIMNPDQGSLKIELVEVNRIEKSTLTLRELRAAQFFLKKGSYTERHNDLPKDDNYFRIEIANIPPASNYSIFLFGKEYRQGYIDVCSEQSGIEIERGKVTTIQLTWSSFMTEPIAPADGAIFGGNTIKLKWQRVDEDSYYHLNVADDSTFHRPVIFTKVTDDEYEIDSALLQKGNYYWKVQCVGRWSPDYYFTDTAEAFFCTGAWSSISHFVYE